MWVFVGHHLRAVLYTLFVYGELRFHLNTQQTSAFAINQCMTAFTFHSTPDDVMWAKRSVKHMQTKSKLDDFLCSLKSIPVWINGNVDSYRLNLTNANSRRETLHLECFNV